MLGGESRRSRPGPPRTPQSGPRPRNKPTGPSGGPAGHGLRACSPQSARPPRRSDASLYCDDVDIRFSKTMNSCKVLQIRYASVGRLLERLTDLRFLSIDFLNTFLHSYRVFTTAVVVLDKLITIYRKPISAIPARWAAHGPGAGRAPSWGCRPPQG